MALTFGDRNGSSTPIILWNHYLDSAIQSPADLRVLVFVTESHGVNYDLSFDVMLEVVGMEDLAVEESRQAVDVDLASLRWRLEERKKIVTSFH